MTKSFVVYHISSTIQVGPSEHGHPHSAYAKDYKTAHGARQAAAKFNARSWRGIGPGPYGWCEAEHYATRVVYSATRSNMISGKEYQEASNTPGYCSPSSEAYWSM